MGFRYPAVRVSGFDRVVLDRAFRSSVEAGAAEQLQVQIYLLLSAVDERDGEFYFLETLQEPRFNQLDSGLYGYQQCQHRGVMAK